MMQALVNTVKKDRFLQGMALMMLLATVFPDLAKKNGILPIADFLSYGVALIFFFHGLGIPREELKKGLQSWRLHVAVQLITFVLFPIIFWIFYPLIKLWMPQDLVFGFFYLCILPSTITSSVALTAVAKGNVSAAIFNATLSNVLGIVLTPLWLHVLSPESGGLPFADAVLDIATFLLLPFVLGQIAHGFFYQSFKRYKPKIAILDRAIILLLVLTAFSESVANGLWQKNGLSVLLWALLGAVLLLALVLRITHYLGRYLKLSVEDQITLQFCGSKKTLASGLPMAKVLLGTHPGLGLVVLPLMLYHQAQLIICAVMAEKYAQRK